MSVEVWRGASSLPLGGHAQSGGSVASGANIAIPAITLQDTTGTSVILAFAGWQTVTAWNAAPAGYTTRSSVATECEALTKDSTTADGTFNVTGTASGTGGTRTQQLEILADLGNRVSQVAVETLYSTTAGQARLSQEAIEVLTKYPSLGNRVSQVAIEVLKSRTDVRDMDFISSVTAVYTPTLVNLTIFPPFIASVTAVYTPSLIDQELVPFISSVTVVYTPTLTAATTNVTPSFIASVTVVYAPLLDLKVPFIGSNTAVHPPIIQLGFGGDGVSQVTLEVLMPYSPIAHISGRS
jgi:hypothetical protein